MHREVRRLQYVVVGGVSIREGRWRVTTVRGRNGVGRGVGFGWVGGEQGRPLKVSFSFLRNDRPRDGETSPLRAQQSVTSVLNARASCDAAGSRARLGEAIHKGEGDVKVHGFGAKQGAHDHEEKVLAATSSPAGHMVHVKGSAGECCAGG